MSEIEERLRAKYQQCLAGEMESAVIKELDGDRIYWQPMTGKQQKKIQEFAEKSTAEGICMHVKTRALDKNGDPIFKGIAIAGLMNDYKFSALTEIFTAMTGAQLTSEDIEGN